MAAAHSLPRRRPASPPSIDSLSDSMKNVSIRKGSTFQISPKQESEYLDPFLKNLALPGLPSRSVTCPKALEDLLIGAGERRAVDLLKRVDDAIAKRVELSSILSEPEVLPVPRFMVENASTPDTKLAKHAMTTRSQEEDKDSGIGSSVASTSEKLREVTSANNKNNTISASAVTRSFSGDSTADDHCLSEFAQKQVNKFIIQPILREDSLKEFHGLIKDIPKKIGSKDIRTLRDLEKTLIFLAPDFSHSPAAYRKFCEVSIRCLHLTVNGVHESDRCLPTDRPYSTNYFIDLVEQIRRYASILAATRAKQARGEELDEMDVTPDDQLELHGGMSHNGQPATITRRRGSKVINLADNQPMSAEDIAAGSVKRSVEVMSDDEDSARRSMARRKKNEPIKTYYCKQTGCTKNFKRPCDLTKHIKTHERPWKCPEVGCKYHDLGWPTEKERERHFNDKHSDEPTLYKCLAPDCAYTSKRESNCKQHMEKAHEIQYVRSKNNGKGKAPVSGISKVKAGKADSVLDTPSTYTAPSPSNNSIASGSSGLAGPSANAFPHAPFDFNPDFESHFNTTYLQPSPSVPITPTWSEDRRTSVGTAATNYSPFDMPMNFDQNIMKTEDYDFAMFGDNNFQQPTPESLHNEFMAAAGFPESDLHQFSPNAVAGAAELGVGGHFNDAMNVDDGFGDDFQLFGNVAQPAAPSPVAFQDPTSLDNMGSQFNAAPQSQTDLFTLFPELAGPQ